MLYRVIVFVVCFLQLADQYKLHTYIHEERAIGLSVGLCPFVGCEEMVVECVENVRVPGFPYTLVLRFDDLYVRGAGQLHFLPTSSRSFTHFTLKGGTVIQSFCVYIGTRDMSMTQIRSVLLHELLHVFLVDHGIYDDSVSGFKLDIGNKNQKTPAALTQDDVKGLYAIAKKMFGLPLRHQNVLDRMMSRSLSAYTPNRLNQVQRRENSENDPIDDTIYSQV